MKLLSLSFAAQSSAKVLQAILDYDAPAMGDILVTKSGREVTVMALHGTRAFLMGAATKSDIDESVTFKRRGDMRPAVKT